MTSKLTTGQIKWRTNFKLNDEQKQRVLLLWDLGFTMTQIAKDFNVAVSTIHRVIRGKMK